MLFWQNKLGPIAYNVYNTYKSYLTKIMRDEKFNYYLNKFTTFHK